ncbi:GNAT family N-acetyltransferase [Octadecabacter sp. 1_MG-2023]|uniref:GNAT family N-acetyltransferase n=1 Tax=unclassified Octadecabacter TaxID=196158 RepID=UPI001C0A17AB|nr:GNAT family N-acetyltransferase [Octadecabacter sp. 1_MG-2023]MBU2993387.1 GNAT family N-acetyltransferase [Octadecabacter sp. B2R22]MDO6733157.1 GNAT family N-acetyltransferase [Octadecabacter sp. 1_MG-2023]
MNNVDRQPTLTDGPITLRPLLENDRADLFKAARDPLTWAGHPASNRYQPDIFNPYFDSLLASRETLVVVLNDHIIGCSRFYTPDEDADGIAIGFTFVSHDHWGGTINRQMKTLMLSHAFKTVTSIWFHIAPTNIRSQKATAKLGAQFVTQKAVTVAGKTDEWLCYQLSKNDWAAQR